MRRDRDCMIVGFTTTGLCNQCLSPLILCDRIPLGRGVHDTALCDEVCQWLAAGRWFSSESPVSSTNKTDRRDILEILLKVALSAIKPNQAKFVIQWRIKDVAGRARAFCVTWRGRNCKDFVNLLVPNVPIWERPNTILRIHYQGMAGRALALGTTGRGATARFLLTFYSALRSHMGTPFKTQFLEYISWSNFAKFSV